MRLTCLTLGCSLLLTAHASANQGESSFTPSSLYVPVHLIRLENSATNRGADLYRCATDPQPNMPEAGSGGDGAGPVIADPEDDAGTPAGTPPGDCLVDMADNAALGSLFSSPIAIEPGTYDVIRLYLCGAGAQSYPGFLKGQVEISGDTYFTTSGAGEVLTRDAAAAKYLELEFSGCGSEIRLPGPVTVAADDAVSISAFFSLRNIAWALLTNQGIPGGCTASANGDHSVCAGYPIPVAYLGAVSPIVDTFYITEDVTDLQAAKAGGQLLLLRTPAGVPFGGFSRRLYSATSVQPSVNYDTPIKTIMVNPDPNTYLIENYGGGYNNVAVDFYVRFPAFQLDTHDGVLTRSDGVTQVPYRAVKQPD